MEQRPNGENPHFTRDNATSVPKEKVEKAKEKAKQVQEQQKKKQHLCPLQAAARYTKRAAGFILC